MRKTLTLMLLALTASPLAACKMFWEHEEKPAAVATTTDTTPAATDSGLVATADPAKSTPPTTPEPSTAVPAKN